MSIGDKAWMILTHPRVLSRVRRILVMAGTVLVVKYVPEVGMQAAILGAINEIMEVWASLDDSRVAEKAVKSATEADAAAKNTPPQG